MIAFEVFLNGIRQTLAGAENLFILMAEVRGLGRLGKHSTLEVHPDNPDRDVWLGVSGGVSAEDEAVELHPKWVSFKNLRVGDIVKIKVFEASKADDPILE